MRLSGKCRFLIDNVRRRVLGTCRRGVWLHHEWWSALRHIAFAAVAAASTSLAYVVAAGVFCTEHADVARSVAADWAA